MRKLFFKKKLDYEKRMKELDQIAEEQQLRQRVRDRERELGLRHTRKKPAWGKAMMAVVYGLCIEIVIYAEVVMWMRFDLSALYALIGVPAAMFGVFWAYAQKSAKENTKGGIVYDMNIRQAETDDLAGMEPENNTDTGEGYRIRSKNMTLEIFLLGLMIVSIFTGLFTEGIKKLLDEMTVKYHSNFLAGGVAVVLSTLVGAGYLILTETQINDKMAVYLIALVLLSWLASMVGYDKVIQPLHS